MENAFPKMRGLLMLLLLLLAVSANQAEASGCPRDEYMCSPTECMFESWICDGKEDCSNGKDERICGSACPHNYFGCSDDTCIVHYKVCNGKPDCKHGEDEEKCGTKCYSTEFSCSNGQCILGKDLRCDGKPDCTDGSDEVDCDKCPQGNSNCSNGDCIKNEYFCDGESDCQDGSDELLCAVTTVSPRTRRNCSSEEVKCSDGSCAYAHFLCFLPVATSPDKTRIPESSMVNTQQCSLRQGCAGKVVALVFGVLALLTVAIVGGFLVWRRQKAIEGETNYLPLGRPKESDTPNEAFTMDNVP